MISAPFAILLFPFKVLVVGAEKLGDVVSPDDEVPLDPRLRSKGGPWEVTVAGLEPTLVTELSEQIRGHSRRRRRGKARAPRYEDTLTGQPVLVVTPDIAAYWDPPADRLAGFNTAVASIEARLTQVELQKQADAALQARRRKEEEELIQILLRVA